MRRVYIAVACSIGIGCGSNDSTSTGQLQSPSGGSTSMGGQTGSGGGAASGSGNAMGGSTNPTGGATSATGGANAAGGQVNASGGKTSDASGGTANPSTGGSASANVIDFCRGRVTDKDTHPLTTLAKPAVGTWVKDPDFAGAQITRISNSGNGDATTPMYSTIPAWNADGSLLMLYHWGDGHVLYDGRTFKQIGALQCTTSSGANPSPSDVEHVMWDPTNPDILRFPSRYAPDSRGALPILYKCNVRTHEASVEHDFSTAPTSCAPGTDELTMGADPQWFPGGLVGLQCGQDVSDTNWRGKKFIYDVTNGKVYTPRSGGTFATAQAPIAAPSGTRVYFEGSVYDNDLNMVRSLNLASSEEHANIGRSKTNHDFYYAVNFDGSDPGVMIAHDMDSGQTIPLVSDSGGWGFPGSGIHITSVNADPRAAGWALASVIGETTRDPLAGEFVLANVDTKAVCRLGRHRSRAGNGGFGYQAEPHPVFHVLADGTLEIVFGSDWGSQNLADTYVMRLAPM